MTSKLPTGLDRVLLGLGAALLIATLAVLITTDSGGGGAQSAPAGAQAQTTDTVSIDNFKFMPADVRVKAGTKLVFDNVDTAAHTATSDEGGAFDTGGIPKGERGSVTIDKPGTYAYHCDFHPFMKATITVTP